MDDFEYDFEGNLNYELGENYFEDLLSALNSGDFDFEGNPLYNISADEFSNLLSNLDPYEVDGLQGSRDEFNALTGLEDPYGVDGQQGSRDEFNALTGSEDPYEVDGKQGSRDESTALTGTKTDTKIDTKTKTDVVKKIADAVGGKDNLSLIAALLGGIAGMKYKKPPTTQPSMWGAQIPNYQSVRGAPGQGISLVRRAASGGIMDLAAGGRPARYLAGGTDGMADKIQTDIDGKQPARLSHGEFVIPADVVSHLGNGNSDAGADVLYDMMAKVRKARTGNPKQGKQINPRKYTPV
jgi:hypothetical protein